MVESGLRQTVRRHRMSELRYQNPTNSVAEGAIQNSGSVLHVFSLPLSLFSFSSPEGRNRQITAYCIVGR